MRTHSHHNTTHETGETLAGLEAAARTQEDRVLAFFRNHFRSVGWTPSEVNEIIMPESPLTSTRRAMTNLTYDGKLVRTEIKRTGPYGRAEFAWQVAGPEQASLFQEEV